MDGSKQPDRELQDMLRAFDAFRAESLLALWVLCQGYLAVRESQHGNAVVEKGAQELTRNWSKEERKAAQARTSEAGWWRSCFESGDTVEGELYARVEVEVEQQGWDKGSSKTLALVRAIDEGRRIDAETVNAAYRELRGSVAAD